MTEKIIPDITILMSTYNRRKYLPSMLKDLQLQTFTNWRLIIINDGGDDVEDIVKSFNDERMEYYNRPHFGKPAQLNFALRMVESKYIGYLDDDDNVLPEHFSLLYEAAEKNGADFVYTNVETVILDNNEQIVERNPIDDSDITWKDIRINNRINHSTILHTKAIADKVGWYDEQMQVLIDFDYIKRLAALVKPVHVHAATYLWNLRQDENGQYCSISGLWKKDPEAAGHSLLTFFNKDPEALALNYMQNFQLSTLKQSYENIIKTLRDELTGKEEQIQIQKDVESKLHNKIQRIEYKNKKHLKYVRLLGTISIVLIILLLTIFFHTIL